MALPVGWLSFQCRLNRRRPQLAASDNLERSDPLTGQLD